MGEGSESGDKEGGGDCGQGGEVGDGGKDGDCISGEDYFGIMLLYTIKICHFLLV